MNRRQFLKSAATTAATIATLRAADTDLAAPTRPTTLPAQNAATNPFPSNASPADAAILARFGSRGVRLHDPSSIIKCKDEYWLFYTGRGVPSYRSRDLIHWERGPAVFTEPPPWVAQAVPVNRGGMDFWAPDIALIAGRYHLYYSVSSFGKNTSAIGLATNPTLDPAEPAYRWSDQGIVIQSSPADKFNAIDPAITQDADGAWWLAFGSFWSGIKLIPLDSKTGKRAGALAQAAPAAPADAPIHSLAHAPSIEAPHIFHHGDDYYLIVNWGTCCRGVNSTYNLRIGRSKKITGPYIDREGFDLLQGGGTLLLGGTPPFIGPGQASIFRDGENDWLSMHYYDATRRGLSMLAIVPVKWDGDGWLAVPVADGK